MADQSEKKSGKGIGCLGVFIIILLFFALIAGSIYIFLPRIISSAISGGAVSALLPEGVRQGTRDIQYIISDNIYKLEEFGLTTDEAAQIVLSLDFDTLEVCLDDIQQSSITNSSDLIDTVSRHIDLSAADLNKLKSDYYTEFKEEELNHLIENLRESPLMMKSGFRVIKGTIIEVLKSEREMDNK
jgi:hypothetical protein